MKNQNIHVLELFIKSIWNPKKIIKYQNDKNEISVQ